MKKTLAGLTFLPILLLAVGATAATGVGPADTAYKLPPREIVAIVDAPPPPSVVVSPSGDAILLVDVEANPPISLLAEPIHRIAGLRITAARGARQRTLRHTAIRIQSAAGGPARAVALPPGARIGTPAWSPDGTRFAFTRDVEGGVELWIGDAASGKAAPVRELALNDVLGSPFEWGTDGGLLARAVPAGRGAAPPAPAVPAGPVVQETAGKVSQMATFQDLISSPHDEALFGHFGRTQLVRVDPASGRWTKLGEPGLVASFDASPDGTYLLVTRLDRPFSYRVPSFYFPRHVEVWDRAGKTVATVADLPVSDEIPRQGVPAGPRSVRWQPLVPATLVWAEALDGGDPLKKVPHRDRLLARAAPFQEPARELLRLRHRFRDLEWTAKPGVALLTEFDRDRRWTATSLVDLQDPAAAKVVFDRSVNDAYKDPGSPVMEERRGTHRVLLQDGDSVYLAGAGAGPGGDRPFLDRLDLGTLKKQRLFQSREEGYERFLAFAGKSRTRILVRTESPEKPPNVEVVDLAGGAAGTRTPLTDYRDPHPRLTKVSRERVTYKRSDGVALSGTLYLPPDRKPGERLPALVWAYPLEYSDADTAGQVRGSTRQFLRLQGPSPLFFVTQGYAVLMDATMPVVGDPETVNDTYVEQITADAKAAVDKLDEMGVADRRRIVVGGHSYGAFMTANLLAHTDLFAAGIARSGAYNRTLTPFGFQTERRSFWEAPEVYQKVSPFTYAHRIQEPILLIHGAADNNSGTFPIQSERLFEAIRGNGGTSRLVLLPNEAHGYRARESVLHTLAEMLEWADRYAKNRPAAEKPKP